MYGEQENPRAFISRALQTWPNVTGNNRNVNQMEQAIIRAKVRQGQPLPARGKITEVVGLGSMIKSVYTNHITHQVELVRCPKITLLIQKAIRPTFGPRGSVLTKLKGIYQTVLGDRLRWW